MLTLHEPIIIHNHYQVQMDYNALFLILTRYKVTCFSIYKFGDVGISNNLIGSLFLANGQGPPPGRWIICGVKK